jgi:DNA-directed RNA polymerase specialized sigma24 family protein
LSSEPDETEQLVDTEPTPELAAQMAEELCGLFDRLDDWTLVRIAVDKLHGYTNEEIAERLDTSLRSIERKLRLIRTIWKAQRPT